MRGLLVLVTLPVDASVGLPTDSWVIGLKCRSRELDCSVSHGLIGFRYLEGDTKRHKVCFPRFRGLLNDLG